MAVVTSDILLLTQAGIKTEFGSAYIRALETADWANIASELPTTLPIQNYAWLGRGALMKAFKDEVEGQSMNEPNYSLTDIIYKGKLDIQRKALEDDQYGQIMLRVRQLAQEPVRHWNQLAYTGLLNGFSSLCYDTKNFFDTTHQEGSSPVQSNKVTSALSDTSLEVADTVMRAYVDDKGVPLNVEPDTLVVGPALARRAWNLVGSPVVVVNPGDGTAGSGATAATPYANYFQGKYRLVVSPYLINGVFDGVTYTGKYNWFLMDTKREVKPIVIQSREDVPITLETDMDEPAAKIKEVYQVTARGRYVQGYGLWAFAYGAQATS